MRCCDCNYRSICTSVSNDIAAFCHCGTRAVFKKSKIEDVLNENAELRAKLEAVVQDIHLLDKCDCCKNNASAELYYDEREQESFPRRYKCDKCYLGAGERNNFEWRGKERE